VQTYPPNSIEADIDAISRIPIVSKILEVVCKTTGMGFAAIARVTEDRWVACSVLDEIDFGLKPGGELKLETTICHEIRGNGQAVVIDHVATDLHYSTHHTPAMYGFQSYISVPILKRDGSFFGTLCAIDPQPAKLTKPEVISMFSLFADLVSFHLSMTEQLATVEANLTDERQTTAIQTGYNQNLTVANSKLTGMVHELAETQRHLQNAVSKVTESEDKLRQAIETGRMGTWSISPVTFEVSMSEFVRTLFGFPLQGQMTVQEILEAVDPDFRDVVKNTIDKAIQNRQHSDMEFPINNEVTKEQVWVRATGKLFLDPAGNVTEYSGMMMDITERKLDDLRKNDFIGMVSHELKTPLTSLNAYVQMLQGRVQKSEDTFTTGALNKAHNQIKKMSVMINGFLNVSRLESGKIQLDKQHFDLTQLVAEMIEEATLMSASHTITLLPTHEITIYADRDKIGNVISNLLSNAVKYSPKGKLITVSCTLVNGHAQVSIQDEGMGIKPQHTDKLFNRFYRIDSKHTQHISGFGIGLYLSAEIIQHHLGKIWVESQVGVGSIFYFTIPLQG
jgi:two-component system sensor histidine kinase VicK